MSVNKIIEMALKTITPDIWPMNCPNEWAPDEYIVYNPELEEAALYADNKDEEWIQYMQIHLFTKGNYIKKRMAIREALQNTGAIITDITTLHEKDSRYIHLCFSCIFEENMEE